MQILLILLIVAGIYAMVDTRQQDTMAQLNQQADTYAKLMEYYHNQAVLACPLAPITLTPTCANGGINTVTSLPGSAYRYGPPGSSPAPDFYSATDGNYIVTTWYPKRGWAGSLNGTVSNIIKLDTQLTQYVGPWNSATGLVGDNVGAVSGTVVITTPFAGVLNLNNGVPVIATPLH